MFKLKLNRDLCEERPLTQALETYHLCEERPLTTATTIHIIITDAIIIITIIIIIILNNIISFEVWACLPC